MKSVEYFKILDDITKYKLQTILNDGQISIHMSHANGCGAKGGMPFPSTMWGVNIKTACQIHDIEWYLAVRVEELRDANERFDNNLKKICDFESDNIVTRFIRRLRIAKYVSGVELIGTKAYVIERGFRLD